MRFSNFPKFLSQFSPKIIRAKFRTEIAKHFSLRLER
jgi:hypothetical protein